MTIREDVYIHTRHSLKYYKERALEKFRIGDKVMIGKTITEFVGEYTLMKIYPYFMEFKDKYGRICSVGYLDALNLEPIMPKLW